MIEELQQEIAKLKQKLKNVQNQLILELKHSADKEHEHAYNWWYETDGDPETEPRTHTDLEDYVPCKDCGRVMGDTDFYCTFCVDNGDEHHRE